MKATQSVRLLLIASITLAAVFVAMYVFFVHTYTGQTWDERLFRAVPRNHTPVFRLSGAILGNVTILAVGGIGLTLLIGGMTRRLKHTVVALGTTAAAVSVAELSKHVLLSRPTTGASRAVSNSFPSGHATVAASVACAVFLVSTPKWRPQVAILGGALAALVGAFTVIQQWHRPSDVLSAFVLAAICACAGGAVLTGWISSVVGPASPRRKLP